jgi:hypothetical protein
VIDTFRIAEVLGGLSLATDVASANPPEKALRTAILAVELGRRHGVAEPDLRDAFYVCLLRYLGCVGFAHEEAHVYGSGDDIATRYVMGMADLADPVGTARRVLRGVGKGGSVRTRIAAVGRLLGDGIAVANHSNAQCDASIKFAELTAMPARVKNALGFICERWDGKGSPHHIEGEGIPIAMRLHHIADIVEIALHRAGRESAIEIAR